MSEQAESSLSFACAASDPWAHLSFSSLPLHYHSSRSPPPPLPTAAAAACVSGDPYRPRASHHLPPAAPSPACLHAIRTRKPWSPPTPLAADKRWGASPTRMPGARIPKSINWPSQRLEIHGISHNTESIPKGAATWVNKPMPPASNAWGLPSLLYPKNDGETGPFSHFNDRPSSRGSLTASSTVGSDFLDSPSAWGPDSCPLSASAVLRSHHLPTAADRLRSTETGSALLL